MEGTYVKPIRQHCKTPTLTSFCIFISKIRSKVNVFDETNEGRRLGPLIMKDKDYFLKNTKFFLNFDCQT
jgi:hypothetical protein